MNSRLGTLYNLSEYFETPLHLAPEDVVMEQSYIAPSIGAEIEVHWRTLIPNHSEWFAHEKYDAFSVEKKEHFNSLCQDIENQRKPLYKKTKELGIPAGHDGFHEFAFSPVNWYKTAAEEIRLLYDIELINPEYENPLHITIANLKNDTDIGLATCAIELLGGASYSRILKACKKSVTKVSWDRKGRCGITKKGKMLLENGANHGVEIRTLMATTAKQVEETLRNTQMLAYAIQSRPNEWKGIKTLVNDEVLKPHGLNKWWKSPQQDPSEWHAFAELLEDKSLIPIKTELRQRISRLEELARESQ